MDWTVLAVMAAATFVGALVQAATGFGFAILAAPVFLVAMNSPGAIPILVALHVPQSLLLVPGIWHRASRWHLKRLVLGAVVGCPVGLWLFAGADVRALTLTVGCLILAVIGLLLVREALARRRRHVITAAGHGTAATLATGAISGVMTALLVMPGPPLMVYFMGARQAADALRALSLSFFALCYIAVTAANIVTGQMPRASWTAVGLLMPAVIAGTLAGTTLGGRFSEAGMRVAILVLLFLSGAGAILSALVG